MPSRADDEQQSGRPVLKALFWAGIGLAPIAMLLLLLADGNGPLRIAAFLCVLSVVLIGLSIALRGDGQAVSTGRDEEIDGLHQDIRKDISSAAQQTHRALMEQIRALQQQVDALRDQVDGAGARSRGGYEPPAYGAPSIPTQYTPPSVQQYGTQGYSGGGTYGAGQSQRGEESSPGSAPSYAAGPSHGAGAAPSHAGPSHGAAPSHAGPSHGVGQTSGGQSYGAGQAYGGGKTYGGGHTYGAGKPEWQPSESRRASEVVHTETFQVTTSRHTYVGDRSEMSGNVYGSSEASGNIYGSSEPSGNVYGGGRYAPPPSAPSSPSGRPDPAEESWTDQRLREMRVGERRASVYADGGNEMHTQDRWASVRQEEPYDSWSESTSWPLHAANPTPALPQRSADPAAAWGEGWGDPEPAYESRQYDELPRAGRDDRWP